MRTLFIFAHIYMFSLLAFTTPCKAQQSSYCSPLDIPLSLSANFGEIRSTHFHSGVDFKTQGVINQNIVSVADGYISRIFVSPSGYGNAIYITHPSLNRMSVYGHMNAFTEQVKEYVEKAQYNNKSFKVNLYPPKDMFVVKKGEFIGLSGNSGSSGGPHLHYEIRDLTTGHALNPITEHNFKIADTTSPTLFSITVVEVENTYGIDIHKRGEKYNLTKLSNGRYKLDGDTITLKRNSYLAIEFIETKDGSTNIFGTHKMELSSGDKLFWGYHIPSVSFSTGRAINSFVLYPETTLARRDIVRTYIPENTTISYYKGESKDGVLYRSNFIIPSKFTLVATDEFNNSSTVSFVVKNSLETPEPLPIPEGEKVYANRYQIFRDSVSKVVFEPTSLQQSAFIKIESYNDTTHTLSPILSIECDEPPFNKAVRVSIKPHQSLIKDDLSKYLICSISDSGKLSSQGGKWENGYLNTSVYSSGKFTISKDTIAPKITPLFKADQKPTKLDFKITDDLSGIASYNGHIDGEWVCFVYDSKNSYISHTLETKRVQKGVTHKLKLIVIDGRGNSSVYEREFSY